jgi:hypothetical protein
MSQRRSRATAVGLIVGLWSLTACGAQKPRPSALNVKKGMDSNLVRRLAGTPTGVKRFKGDHGCWWYTITRSDMNLNGLIFCFKSGKVTKIIVSHHL